MCHQYQVVLQEGCVQALKRVVAWTAAQYMNVQIQNRLLGVLAQLGPTLVA